MIHATALARAVRTEEADDLSLGDVDVDAGDGGDNGLLFASLGVELARKRSRMDHAINLQLHTDKVGLRLQPHSELREHARLHEAREFGDLGGGRAAPVDDRERVLARDGGA